MPVIRFIIHGNSTVVVDATALAGMRGFRLNGSPTQYLGATWVHRQSDALEHKNHDTLAVIKRKRKR